MASEDSSAATNDRPQRSTAAATREKIILAAEQLFASRGIEGVSLREIALKAGQGNNNAVQYHFQSKNQLVYAIFEHRVSQMEGPRSLMLEQADRQGRLSDARTLLEILHLPYLSLTDESGRHTYAGFLAEYLTRHRPIGVKHPLDDRSILTASLQRLMSLIEARISYVPPEIALSRLVLCNLMFLNMLVRHDTETSHNLRGVPLSVSVRDTLDTMVACLCRPYQLDPIDWEASV